MNDIPVKQGEKKERKRKKKKITLSHSTVIHSLLFSHGWYDMIEY